MIRSAVEQGVSEGFQGALVEWCDGYDEPQERCPMRPRDGCACLAVRWRRLPWWRRLTTPKPKQPADGDVLDCLLSIRIEEAISDGLARIKKEAP
ncbi:MAG: hypothetical protein AAFQ90_12695 [Pseudomonadota bacterium]